MTNGALEYGARFNAIPCRSVIDNDSLSSRCRFDNQSLFNSVKSLSIRQSTLGYFPHPFRSRSPNGGDAAGLLFIFGKFVFVLHGTLAQCSKPLEHENLIAFMRLSELLHCSSKKHRIPTFLFSHISLFPEFFF
jgi:hypothetical protein